MPTTEPDYGAECVKVYYEYAAKHLKPGDIVVWGASPSDYGHVEVVTRRTAWRWRLATLRRCLMWWKR